MTHLEPAPVPVRMPKARDLAHRKSFAQMPTPNHTQQSHVDHSSVLPLEPGRKVMGGGSRFELIGVDLQRVAVSRTLEKLVIPGPSPAVSAMQPGIQVSSPMEQKLD